MALIFPEPKFYRLFELDAAPGTVYDTGGCLKVTAVADGTFTGEYLSGTLQSGGGHWDTADGDDIRLDRKYILKTTDGAVILMNADGWRQGEDEKVHVHFQTGAKKYDWLNHAIAIGRTETAESRPVLAVYAMLPSSAVNVSTLPADLKFEQLYYVEVNVADQMKSGKFQGGNLMVIPITSGTFEGKRLSGTVECLGADYNILRQGMPVKSHIATRYMLKTDDGAHISLVTDGRLYMDKAGVRAMMSGAANSVELAYFRQHLMFTTGDSRYSWLNKDLCFAVIGQSKDRVIRYRAYALR